MRRSPIFVTGGSGGIAKSTSSSDLAQALALTRPGARVALVDANLGQQTQRSMLRIGADRGLETVRTTGDVTRALVPPRDLPGGARFALLPGPIDPRPANMRRLLETLGFALGRLQELCDWVVVDLDKTDPILLADPTSVAGGVMMPWLNLEEEAAVIWKLESMRAKLTDGLRGLKAIRHPDRTAVVGVVPSAGAPDPADELWEAKVKGLGRYLGADVWSPEAAAAIAAGSIGYRPGDEPDWLTHALAWAGATPDDHEGRGRRWFRRRK